MSKTHYKTETWIINVYKLNQVGYAYTRDKIIKIARQIWPHFPTTNIVHI